MTAEGDSKDNNPDLRKEPNRRANRNPGHDGPERRVADRRKSQRI